jgi:multicomponent Na+:H+ antiporter subunit D
VTWLLVAPIVWPLLVAVAALAVRTHGRTQRAMGIAGPAGVLVAAIAILVIVDRDGVQAVQLGAWPAPFGISIVADLLSGIMLVTASFVALACLIYAADNVESTRVNHGYFTLTNVLMAGVSGAFLTGDLFNLYVWFEVMLIASFVLLALGGRREQIEGAVKYVTLNLIASAIFLSGAGLTYGVAGTLNMADLAVRLPEIENTAIVTAIATLFMVSFGIKAAAFPIYGWLPASYHTPPTDISALFSGLLTKVGVYALIRAFTLLFTHDTDTTHTVLMIVAGFTMVSGVLGAVAQTEMRRLLSFHIVSQIGYMLMGLAIFTPLAVGAAIFFVVHNMVTKTALFLVAGTVHRIEGTGMLKSLGGFYRSYVLLAVVFGVAAASLAGIPPFSGFIGKFALARAGFEAGSYAIVAVSLAVGALTMYSMTKLWLEVFWKARPTTDAPPRPSTRFLVMPAIMLAAGSVGLGLAAGPALDLVVRAGEQLVSQEAYINAVLGETALAEAPGGMGTAAAGGAR